MFKWPAVPSAQADINELADFVELTAWQSGGISITATSQALGRLEENDYSNGVRGDDDVDEAVVATYSELARREESCRDGYPFIIEQQGYTLRVHQDDRNSKHVIYKYLLLSTRLNMNTNKCYSDCDGTLLLEELAAEVAKGYFGDRAQSLVFGTAAGDDHFPDKVNELCNKLGEGGGFINRDEGRITAKDGKLDVVVWKSFADVSAGKLIGFGQCKTGTHYRGSLTQLQPSSFCGKWLRDQPACTPIRMFFISDALSREHWYSTVSDAGILFDRCRIIDFCDSVTPETLGKIKSWTEAAAKNNDLPGL